MIKNDLMNQNVESFFFFTLHQNNKSCVHYTDLMRNKQDEWWRNVFLVISDLIMKIIEYLCFFDQLIVSK